MIYSYIGLSSVVFFWAANPALNRTKPALNHTKPSERLATLLTIGAHDYLYELLFGSGKGFARCSNLHLGLPKTRCRHMCQTWG